MTVCSKKKIDFKEGAKTIKRLIYIIYHLCLILHLQKSVIGMIHALWEILWTYEKYLGTEADYQRYDRR